MKRTSTNQPLTSDDVAERLDRAALRTLRILMDARQQVGLFEPVKHSRYLTNTLAALAAEIGLWGIAPQEMPTTPSPAPRV